MATQCVSQAIRKAKLQKEYKLPDKPAALKSRVEGRQHDASRSRLAFGVACLSWNITVTGVEQLL